MSETENGAPKAPDKAMQHALLKEKRAHETCERLRAQCKTQASLMCRLFATKLQEQQAICARAISAPPGERAQVQAEADAFGASTRWILEEAAAAGLAQARDKEVEALREENETLRKKVSELETKLIDNNAIIIEPEEPQSSLLMRRLEDERDKCRDEARAARGRVLELEGGMNARQAVDGEVAALRREVAALRASSNGHTVDPDEIKRLKKEHKAALKAALRDGGSSSEREKEELMAAMEREVEQARSGVPSRHRRDSWPSHFHESGFFFDFEYTGRRRGARALRQGAISPREGAAQGAFAASAIPHRRAIDAARSSAYAPRHRRGSARRRDDRDPRAARRRRRAPKLRGNN